MIYHSETNCVHDYIVYRGTKSTSAKKNWCQLCGRVREKDDVVNDKVVVITEFEFKESVRD